MQVQLLEEPELEFGGGRHIDIRFGLMNHGPLDAGQEGAPQRIRVGITGTAETVEGVTEWLEKCRFAIPAKSSRQPNLFPRFPGFDPEVGFRSSLVLRPADQRTIQQRVFDAHIKSGDHNAIVQGAVDAFYAEFQHIVETDPVDVLLCSVPDHLVELLDADRGQRPQRGPSGAPRLDFHDLLKARCMTLQRPVQLILPGTYDALKQRKQRHRPENLRKLQDEATRAWNFHTALYYKAGGKPWRLVREPSQLTTCFVGIAFYKALDGSRMQTSMAQVFDERGDGVIVRGGPVPLNKDNRHVHLTAAEAQKLLAEALKQYRNVHKTLPARVVVHKSSPFNTDEIEGFTLAAQDANIDTSDFVSIGRSHEVLPRLFRYGEYPPCRGTLMSLDKRSHILYTRGSVEFFSTYAGMYVPRPLYFECDDIESTPRHLASEILGLTKMNWNGTQFDGGYPITIEAARRVGSILKYINDGDLVAPRYSHYM